MSARREELAAALATVRNRITTACGVAGRPIGEVRLLAVTKKFPATDAALLAGLGVTDLAESREQEAGPKADEVAELLPAVTVRWHMVGRLQRNKARAVARWAAEIQSVDSPRLVEALVRGVRQAMDAGERTAPVDVLLQVSLDGDGQRGGCPIPDLGNLADGVARTSELRLRGIMAVAPMGVIPDTAFELLADVAEKVRNDHPGATEMSSGMSSDLESAITHGSTCVRVGTALLGGRPLISP